ncbi:MAG TPA: DUF4105 domain-containing protein [Terriglobales bacterium]|nr:DUF4105 domain-containing protein [Terriglobales bacterium]
MRRIRIFAFAFSILVALLITVWAAAAIYFDLPFPSLRIPLAVFYLVLVLAAMWFLRRGSKGLAVAFTGFVIVIMWWLSIKPSNDLDWELDKTATAYADINGDQVTIHNFRFCDYRTEGDYTCQWQTRSYNLQHLRGADLFITWWGSPWIAHPIVSFDFGDEGHVAMSIETRNRAGQVYSAIRGFFRQYALTYIASDERDVIRLRTNYRQHEEVYLFRTAATPALARKVFLDYFARANSLHVHPEWYNALTNNCTTNIAGSVADARQASTTLDWRILLNGKMDEMMYERNDFVSGGLTLKALRQQAHINDAARAAGNSPDFSRMIRQGRVGFTQ